MSASLPVIVNAPARAAALELDPRAYARGLSCVHCGLCLPACPTYTETGNEADSPRGRIQLMLGLADGQINLTSSVKHHLDLCLDCRACETACPSGVVYHELIEDARVRFATMERRSFGERLLRWFLLNILTRPTRLKLALLPIRLLQKTGIYSMLRRAGLLRLLPPSLQKMQQMLPEEGRVWPARLPAVFPGTARRVLTDDIGFFSGCVGSVLFDRINRMTIELLALDDAAVRTPREQVCCGAIHFHNGQIEVAKRSARRNIDAFCQGSMPRLIVTNIAGCGAMLREYDALLRDDAEYRDRARDFAARVRDFSEAISEIDLPPQLHPVHETVTYHDACHLVHAQRVTDAPRALLGRIPGLHLRPLPESDMCCGAAGTYNIEHPDMATRLAQRKLDNIAATGASVCVTGNAGCALHIQSQARAWGQALRVVHPVELLHRAVFGLR